MTDRLPDATYLRALAKWLMLKGIGAQTDHERLVQIAERLEWMDISTAPKDGTHVLIAECHYVVQARYVDNGWYELNNHPTDSWGQQAFPSHWKPLPAPPVVTIGGG